MPDLTMTRVRTFAAAVLAMLATPAFAEPLMTPEGPVLLTISGDITHTNVGDTAQFDRAMLEAMQGAEIVTDTIWTPGMHTFTGVSLKALLDMVGANGATIDAKAINDYSVEIPVSDAVESGPIIAFDMDGAPMSRRDKGPLWVIYPYASDADYRTEVIYARSIWQLDRLTVRE